jgi:O-antigen ligase
METIFSYHTIRGLRVKPAMIGLCVCLPLLLVLATVFVLDHRLANGVVSGKYFWFYGSMGLVALSAVIMSIAGWVRHPRCCMGLRPYNDGLNSCVLLFVAGIFISTLVFNHDSLNLTKCTILVLLTVLFFHLQSIINELKNGLFYRNLFYFFMVITALVEALWGLRQLYGFASSQHGLFRTTGSFFNPGPYAGYLAVIFPLALQFFLAQGTSYKLQFVKWISGITCIVCLLVLPATLSRAAWLALIAGSAVVLYAHYAKRFSWRQYYAKHTKQVWSIGVSVLFVVLVGLAGIYFLKKDSADGRLLMWKVSMQAVVRHPFGVGLGNFSGAYGEAQAAYMASGRAGATEQYVAGNPEYGFNEYLQLCIEAGLVSLVLFVGIIVLSIKRMLQSKNWGALGSLTALLVFACFSYPFSVLPFLIVWVFLAPPSAPPHR